MEIIIKGDKSEAKMAAKLNDLIEEVISEYEEEESEEDIDAFIDKLLGLDEDEASTELKPYQVRMQNEYSDLNRRYKRLNDIINKAMNDTLEFKLACPIYLLEKQSQAMGEYLNVLEARAEIEGVPLE